MKYINHGYRCTYRWWDKYTSILASKQCLEQPKLPKINQRYITQWNSKDILPKTMQNSGKIQLIKIISKTARKGCEELDCLWRHKSFQSKPHIIP